jgi:hypothetical protein
VVVPLVIVIVIVLVVVACAHPPATVLRQAEP